MKTAIQIGVLAVLLVAPSRCFALWDVLIVSKEQAKELGMEVRSKAGNRDLVQVQLEFKTDGKLKDFTGVFLKFGEKDKLALSVSLREDRSKPGHVTISFTADSAQLDKLTLTVPVPYRDGGLGGVHYEIHVKDFVQLKKAR